MLPTTFGLRGRNYYLRSAGTQFVRNSIDRMEEKRDSLQLVGSPGALQKGWTVGIRADALDHTICLDHSEAKEHNLTNFFIMRYFTLHQIKELEQTAFMQGTGKVVEHEFIKFAYVTMLQYSNRSLQSGSRSSIQPAS